MLLPKIDTTLKDLSLLQTKWKSILDVILGNPSLDSVILTQVPLNSGSNVINHTLGRKLMGWRIIRQRQSATVYDTQDSNSKPQLTLQLTASANVIVDLECF